jgi:hypothetical protein
MDVVCIIGCLRLQKIPEQPISGAKNNHRQSSYGGLPGGKKPGLLKTFYHTLITSV